MYLFLNSRKYLLAFSLWLTAYSLNAQCAMCRAQLEGMDDQSLAEGINDGIVYLMAVPYILVALVSYIIYRGYKKDAAK